MPPIFNPVLRLAVSKSTMMFLERRRMRLRALKGVVFLIVAAAALGVGSARAADCGDSAAGFNEWLTSFKEVAIRNGISQQVVDSALNGVAFDPSVAAHDRGQNFGSNFAAFSARHVTPARIKKGKMMMLAYAEPLERIEQRYGVPGAVVVAIWGLETDFGAGLGGYSTSQRAGDARLRLPPGANLSGRTHRCAHACPARSFAPIIRGARGRARSVRPNSCRRPI